MSNDTLLEAFFAVLGVTVLVLATAMILGWKRSIRAHVAAIVGFVVSFAATVVLAEMIGRRFTFDKTIEHIHLPLAFTGTALLALPLVTGWRRLKAKGSLRAHRIAIVVFLTVFLAAAGTGLGMLTTRTPIP
jgi:hypothetical protein